MRNIARHGTGLLAALVLVFGAAPGVASAAVLYDQTGSLGTSGAESQLKEATPLNSDQAADDFTVPAGEHWAISEVDVIGTGGNDRPVNVSLHPDAGGLPGSALFTEDDIVAPGSPSYDVPLTGAPVLDPGTYWVSVQEHVRSLPLDNQWLWSNVTTQTGSPAVWQNPGGGEGQGCLAFAPRFTTCGIGNPGESDQAFKLLGTRVQRLSVARSGSGGGTVASDPAGVTCAATCTGDLPQGSSVALTPQANPGSVFTGWSGGGCSGTGPCRLGLGADTAVTATFAAVRQLTVARDGDGAGSVSSAPGGIACGATCGAGFVDGTGVDLVATPNAGSAFAGWSGGGCSGTGPCHVVLGGDTLVTAHFVPTRRLQIMQLGVGKGTVTSVPAGISCGRTCATALPVGTSVLLAAKPRPGSVFGGWWGGPCQGTGRCRMTLGIDSTVEALFVPSNVFTLGAVSRNVRAGTARLVAVVPDAGRLVLAGPGLRTTTVVVSRAERTSLAIRPVTRLLARLRARHVARVRLRVTFTPAGGNARTLGEAVSLRRR